MIYSHFPIQYQPQERLEKWKTACQKERQRMRLPIVITCNGCEFELLCTKQKPCKDFAFARYLPRKVLATFSLYQLEVKSWTAITKKKQLRIRFSDETSITFSIGLCINGREVTENILQVLLRRFTKRFQHLIFCKQKVIRWKF